MRFTSKDSVDGKFEEPLSLHKYLYCQNESISRIDTVGLLYEPAGGGGPNYNYGATQDIINRATDMVGSNFITGPWEAFGPGGEDRVGEFDYKVMGYTF
jgi:hypothetical protein